MDRGAWWATIHRITKSEIHVKNFLLLSSLDFLFFRLKVKHIILAASRNINTAFSSETDMAWLQMRQPGESGKAPAGKHPGGQPIRGIHPLRPWDSPHRSRPCCPVCKTLLHSLLSFDSTFYFNLWQIISLEWT